MEYHPKNKEEGSSKCNSSAASCGMALLLKLVQSDAAVSCMLRPRPSAASPAGAKRPRPAT
jgi:hypothetical protein